MITFFAVRIDRTGVGPLILAPFFYILFRLYYTYAMYLIYAQRGLDQIIYRVLTFIFGPLAEAVILFSIRNITTAFPDLPETLLGTSDIKSFDEKMKEKYGGETKRELPDLRKGAGN